MVLLLLELEWGLFITKSIDIRTYLRSLSLTMFSSARSQTCGELFIEKSITTLDKDRRRKKNKSLKLEISEIIYLSKYQEMFSKHLLGIS